MSPIRLLFVLDGIAVAVVLPFASVILADRGFDPPAIGLVIALTSVATVVSVSAWGHVADVVLGRARALQVAVLVAAAILVVFALPLPAVLVGAAYVAYAASFGAVGPLADALAVNAMRDPAREYGRVRALMSGSFALASVALGLVYGVGGYGPAALLFGVIGVAIAVAGGRVPDLARATLVAHRRGGAIREAFAVQPALPRILVAIGLVYSGVLAGFTFLPLRIVELGGGAPEVAIASAVSAAVEIGAMIAAGRLVPRVGLRLLFGASALLYAVSLALWGVLPSPEAIIVSRPVSGIGYAGLWIAGVMTIQRLLPSRLQGSGQALFTITATGVAGVLANIGGGLVYGGQGAGALFAIAAGLAVAGAVVGWTALPARGAPPGVRAEPGPTPGSRAEPGPTPGA